MKLGNDTIGLRKPAQPLLDGNGQPVKDEFGDAVLVAVDVEVRWCSMTPTTRVSANDDEPENRAAPTTDGMTLLAPPDTDLTARDVVIWPITGRTGEGPTLQLAGDQWQVIGRPGPWAQAIQAQLRRSS